MTVSVREYKKSKRVGFEVDIRFEWPDGTDFRRRYRAPVSTKTQALAWGKAREIEILTAGKDGKLTKSRRAERPAATEVPTLKEFWPRFIDGHCKANRHKPSSIERKESAYRTWLKRFEDKRLDEILAPEITELKTALADLSAKSTNNVLTSLSACLKFAGPDGLRRSEGLGIIKHVPRIRLVPLDSDDKPEWYEEPEFQRLVAAAKEMSPSVYVLVLLAGDAGLRKAEIAALRWSDLDMKRRMVHVQRSIWEGKEGEKFETTPKSNKRREVPMTDALFDALEALPRQLPGARVFRLDDGRESTDRIVQGIYQNVQRGAGLPVSGGIHRLRHTFVSRLAASGAPVRTIQKLAGHSSLSTTEKYMHVAPTNLTTAIALLSQAHKTSSPRSSVGEALEKGSGM